MRHYLGDGVFADYNNHNLYLTTSDGIRDTNTIIFEPEILVAFLAYIEYLKGAADENL